MFTRRAAFLDRDGTLIDAIHRPGFANGAKEITAPFTFCELKFKPDAQGTVRQIQRMGLLAILITNQPDVAHS